METIPFKVNEEAIEARKKIEPFGKIKQHKPREYIQLIEKPLKFKRPDENEVLEEVENKKEEVYKFRPSLSTYTARKPASGDIYIPPSLLNEKATIKVTNIPTEISRQMLESIIIKNTGHHPMSTNIALDRDTRESRGFGFVEFNSIEKAKDCVKKIDRYQIDGFLLGAEFIKEK